MKSEPLFIPAVVQGIISIAAIVGLKAINIDDRESLTFIVGALWTLVTVGAEMWKRRRVTPTNKAAENVAKVLEANGASEANVERAVETIKSGEPAYLPPRSQ